MKRATANPREHGSRSRKRKREGGHPLKRHIEALAEPEVQSSSVAIPSPTAAGVLGSPLSEDGATRFRYSEEEWGFIARELPKNCNHEEMREALETAGTIYQRVMADKQQQATIPAQVKAWQRVAKTAKKLNAEIESALGKNR